MKKLYNKPSVEIMTIEGNDVICGSCSSEGKKPLKGTVFEDIYKEQIDKDKSGTITEDEINCVFNSSETQCTNIIENYCKFTSNNGTNLVAWS